MKENRGVHKQRLYFAYRALFLLVFLVCFSFSDEGNAEILPPDRVIDWTTAGVPGGIPTNRTNIIDVTKSPYNADNSGNANAADATAAIQRALDNAPANSVIYLPAGKYKINGNINISKDNLTLRGAGEATVLDCQGTVQTCIFLGIDTDWPWPTTGPAITGGGTKGSTLITLSDTSGFQNNQLIRISQTNNAALPELSVSGGDRRRFQMTHVVEKKATTLKIFPGLYWDMQTRSPQVRGVYAQVNFSGVEDLVLDGSNGTRARMIDMWQTYGTWIKNVHSINTSNYHFYLLLAVNSEVRHSFAEKRKEQGTNGAAILMERSAGNLIEDNILYGVFPHIEVNFGSAGNVFAYNLCELNDVYSEMMGASIDSNHGAHNSFNLYEGNVASMFQGDSFFGSVSEDVLFRNRFHGTNEDGTGRSNVNNSKAVDLGRFSRKVSVIGNVLGMPQSYWTAKARYTLAYERTQNGFGYHEPTIYRLGYPNIGNNGYSGTAQPSAGIYWRDWGTAPGATGFQELDLDVAATTTRKGNWNGFDQAIPASESLGTETLKSSMYKTSKPKWFGNLNWPPFDPRTPTIDLKASIAAIPAGYRYLNKGSDPYSPEPPSKLRISPTAAPQ